AGAGAVVWFYLWKALLPLGLAFVYPQWDVQTGDIRWWLPLAAALAVTALLIWWRNTPLGLPVLVALGFFWIALLPVVGFTDVGFMKDSLVADHYQHIALIAVVALVAPAATHVAHSSPRTVSHGVSPDRSPPDARFTARRAATAVVAAAAVITL